MFSAWNRACPADLLKTFGGYAADVIRVSIFGALVIEDEGRTLGPRDLGGTKPKQLFEILISERGRAVTKDRIADLLWGEEPPRNVAATLETYVSVLRRNLRAIVRTEPGAYRVEMDALELDLDQFDAERASAAAARDGRRAARRHLDAALALVRGEVLEDEPFGTWARRLREVYRERHVQTLIDASELAIADADAVAALALAERAIELDLTCERGHVVTMLAHHASGRRDAALAAYQRCRDELGLELGVEPRADTIALAAAIRRGEALPQAPRSLVATPPTGPVSDMPLIGRATELAVLERAARDALAGTASLLLIEGEAGIGKTRLVDELVSRLGVKHVWRAKCRLLEQDLAFGPMSHALRSAGEALADDARFPGLCEIVPELAGAPRGRARAFESLVALVAAQSPLVLVFDDLQWADASSLSAIAYLLRRSQHIPLAVIGTFRTEDVAPDSTVRSLEATLHLDLAPLGDAELAALGVADLRTKTGGNPLLVVEYLRALDDDGAVPARLRDVVLARSRAAGADGHRLLVAASVLGSSFDPELLARLLDGDPIEIAEQLEALCARRLLQVTGNRFDFRHDLIRQMLYESLSPTRRRLMHGRAVVALEASDDHGALAVHAELAGAHEQALRNSIRAGDRARARWANLESIAHYERALRIADAQPGVIDTPALESLLLRLGRVLTTVGRPLDGQTVIGRAHDSAAARGDHAALFDALEALAVAHQHGASNPSGALAFGQRALALAEQLGDPAMSRAHLLIGNPAGSLGKIDDAIAHCQHSIAHAERAGIAPSPTAFGRLALALHHRGDETASLVWSERAEAAATAQLAEESLLMSRWVRSLALTAVGRYREAWAALNSVAAIGCGEETFWHARVPNTYGAILAELCLYDRALERDLESLEVARKILARPVREAEMQTLLNAASDRVGLGLFDAARADLETVRGQVAEIEYARFRWVTRLHAVDAELAIAERVYERALASADSCLILARKHGQSKYEIRGRIANARALAGLGKTAAAVREARTAGALADKGGFVGLSWRGWWAAYEISNAVSDLGRAQKAVSRAAEQLDEPLRAAFLRAVPVAR